MFRMIVLLVLVSAFMTNVVYTLTWWLFSKVINKNVMSYPFVKDGRSGAKRSLLEQLTKNRFSDTSQIVWSLSRNWAQTTKYCEVLFVRVMYKCAWTSFSILPKFNSWFYGLTSMMLRDSALKHRTVLHYNYRASTFLQVQKFGLMSFFSWEGRMACERD